MAHFSRRDAVARPKTTVDWPPDRAQSLQLVQLDMESAATSPFRERLHLSQGRLCDFVKWSREQLARSTCGRYRQQNSPEETPGWSFAIAHM